MALMNDSKNLSGYSLVPYQAIFWPHPDQGAAPNNGADRYLVAIDAGQAKGLAQRVRQLHPPERCMTLYEGTFAENAIDLSPLLVELSLDPQQAALELSHLDALCANLPIMSLVKTTQSPVQWLQHLRTLLRLQMANTDYLWRLADTQMLQATASILNAEQTANVFGPCRSWWFVTADGALRDAAFSAHTLTSGRTEPLQLTEHQERALLTATAAHMLSGQIRSLDLDFKTRLTHAEQSRFASGCVDEARESFLDEDSELLGYALSKWQKQDRSLPKSSDSPN
jgi:hypothetical protein